MSYKCSAECKHCMYACSPKWRNDWISKKDAEKALSQLAMSFNKVNPHESDNISLNTGLHFTGGEPFLNFDLLLQLTQMANELKVPAPFVETNAFWCIDNVTTREKLVHLKELGLKGLMVSINPFLLEQISFEKIHCG